MPLYEITLRATIEIGGHFEADTYQEAVAAATAELRTGDISDIVPVKVRALGDDEADAVRSASDAADNPPAALSCADGGDWDWWGDEPAVEVQ